MSDAPITENDLEVAENAAWDRAHRKFHSSDNAIRALARAEVRALRAMVLGSGQFEESRAKWLQFWNLVERMV